MAARDNVTPLRGRACPVCGKRTNVQHQPFCSVRCKDVDLSRWLTGHYRVATEETPPDGGPAGEAEGDPEGAREDKP